MRAAHAVFSFVCLTLAAVAGPATSAEAQVSVFRLQALNESGVRDGTCFVIRQEQRPDGTFLVLVTSARLFERESGRRARLYVDPQAPAMVERRVFGFVSECERGRVPEITPLTVSKSFLLRAVPGWGEPSSEVPQFNAEQPNPLPDR